MQQRGIPETDYTVLAAAPHEVSTYLSASDAGLAFIKPCFSKIASSPTKYAEYLACGLPIIINAGIGDSESLLDDNVGTFVTDLSEAHLNNAAEQIDHLVLDRDNVRQRTRQIAERRFDVSRVGVERYLRLYERVFDLVR
jgi:glycosyltransferase involved in cell wall biosynthesis